MSSPGFMRINVLLDIKSAVFRSFNSGGYWPYFTRSSRRSVAGGGVGVKSDMASYS